MTERPRSYIAPLRVRCAFGQEAAGVEPMIVVLAHEGRVTLRTLHGGYRVGAVTDVTAFTAALDRPDLTRLREHPFLLVNVVHRLVALAFGPTQLPNELRVPAHVVRLEDGSAVEIPGFEGTQPSWLLFEADIS